MGRLDAVAIFRLAWTLDIPPLVPGRYGAFSKMLGLDFVSRRPHLGHMRTVQDCWERSLAVEHS